MESVFPRGSSSAAGGDSAKSLKRPLPNDNIFGSKRTERIEIVETKSKKKKTDNQNIPQALPSIGLGMTKSNASNIVRVENIQVNKYTQGSVVLGFVLQVTESKIIVSMPGGFTGAVSTNEISDYFYKMDKKDIPSLDSIIKVHQVVRCYVLGQFDKPGSKKKSIVLSMRASLVNKGLAMKHFSAGFPVYGHIASVEDHGYIVGTGINGVNCFLPSNAVPKEWGTLTLGRPVECVASQVNEGSRTVTVRVHPKAVYEAITRGTGLTFQSIIPGMMMNVVIESVVENGLLVNFLGIFHGVIDLASFPRPCSAAEAAKMYSVGDVIMARTIFVDHANKSVRLSLRPHVLEMRVCNNLPDLGDVLTDLTVAAVMKKQGILLFKAPEGAEDVEENDEHAADSEAHAAAAAADDNAMETDDAPANAAADKDASAGGAKDSKKLGRKDRERKRTKEQRDRDEAILGVYIPRSALTKVHSSGGDGGDSDDEDETAVDPHHKSEALDADRISKVFKTGQVIPAVKVTGFSLVEGWAMATNFVEIVKGEIAHASHVAVGQLIPVEIKEIRDFGLVVTLGSNRRITAICPTVHTADVVVEGKLKKKFKIGQKLTMRVWEVEGNSIVMSNKKSIVDVKPANMLLDYETAKPGDIITGVISNIKADGITLRFFNKIRGLIPASVLTKQGVLDPAESYRIGQILRVVVIRKVNTYKHNHHHHHASASTAAAAVVDEAKKREFDILHLGLDLNTSVNAVIRLLDDEPLATAAATTASAGAVSGAGEQGDNEGAIVSKELRFVSGRIYKIDDNKDGAWVRLDDGRNGRIGKTHFYDKASTAEHLFAENSASEIAIGYRVENALVLSQQKGVLHLTVKPLLLHAAHSMATATNDISLPATLADLVPGQVVAGFVAKVEKYGVLVRFRGNLMALAPRANIADKFIPTSEPLHFTPGDSIRCVVQRVELSKERASVTLKPSIVPSSAGEQSYLATYLREAYYAATAIKDENKILPAWKDYPLGSTVAATVASIESYGVVLTGEDGITMMLARNVSEDSKLKLKEGDEVKVVTLDIDYEQGVLDVTLDTSILKTKKVKKEKESKKGKKETSSETATAAAVAELAVNGQYSATIELVHEAYLVVSLHAQIGYVMLADYHHPAPAVSDFTIGLKVTVKVMELARTPRGGSYPHEGMLLLSHAMDSSKDRRARMAAVQKEAQESDAKMQERLTGNGSDADVQRQKFLETLHVGHGAKWVVAEVTPLELHVLPENHASLGLRIKAVVHLSGAIKHDHCYDNLHATLQSMKSAVDNTTIHAFHPFYGLEIGSSVYCHVLQVRRTASGSAEQEELTVYLSSSLSKSKGEPNKEHDHFRRMVQSHGKDELRCPSVQACVVTAVDDGGVTVALSPYITSHLSFMDISHDTALLKKFRKYCYIGMRLVVAVTKLQKENDRIKSLHVNRAAIESVVSDMTNSYKMHAKDLLPLIETDKPINEGDMVSGILNLHATRVAKPPAFLISLPYNRVGRVCITEVADPTEWCDMSHLFASAADATAAAAAAVGGKGSKSGKKKNKAALPGGQKHGDMVDCRVLSVDDKGHVELSLRPSRLAQEKITVALQPDAVPQEGSVVYGFVANTSSKGCFVRVTAAVTGQVLMRDLSDEFVESPATEFPVGKLVKARLLSYNPVEHTAKLSLKPSVVDGNNKAKQQMAALHEGSIVTGKIQSITDNGVFVAIDGTSLVGLSRRAAAIAGNKSLHEEYEVGNVVRAKILQLRPESLKIALGLRESYFQDAAEEDDEEDEDGSDSDEEEEDEEEQEEEEESGSDEEREIVEIVDSDDDEEDEEVRALLKANAIVISDSEEDEEAVPVAAVKNNRKRKASEEPIATSNSSNKAAKKAAKEAPAPPAPAPIADSDDSDEEEEGNNIFSYGGSKKAAGNNSGGLGDLVWDDFAPAKKAVAAESDAEESSSDGDEDDDEAQEGAQKGSKLRSRQKEAQRRKEEAVIRERERAIASGNLVPESKEDFERLVIANPNSSYIWVQYMAFYLQSADIDAARGVAARALRTIGFREEEEKFNVWITLLNMEHKYGSMESLEKAFTKAVAESKGKLIYLAMAETYEKAGDHTGAEGIFNKALKRPQYKKSKKVWIAYLQFKLRTGDVKGAKEQLSRAMQSLSRHKHIEVISKYALCEFDVGSVDRGRVLFEELLNTYPKRTDLWHLYVDKEVKLGHTIPARQLFERMIASKTNTKNMKAIFKKYLAFEVKCGTEATQDEVKEKARNYVNSLA